MANSHSPVRGNTTSNSQDKPVDWRKQLESLPIAAKRLVLGCNAQAKRLIQYKVPPYQPVDNGLWRCSLSSDHSIIELSFEPDQALNTEARHELQRISSDKAKHLQVLKQTRASKIAMLKQPQDVQDSNAHTLKHWTEGIEHAEAEVARLTEIEEAHKATLSRRHEEHYRFPVDLGE